MVRERRNFRVPSRTQIYFSLLPLSPHPVPPIWLIDLKLNPISILFCSPLCFCIPSSCDARVRPFIGPPAHHFLRMSSSRLHLVPYING
jgi:hypothetical protein